jgi:hypothetical protein
MAEYTNDQCPRVGTLTPYACCYRGIATLPLTHLGRTHYKLL